MCGFAGYWVRQASRHSDDVLNQMAQSLYHRGPDDAGQWVSPDHRLAFVFRRLSIIDMSAVAAQPMMDAQQSIVLVFNGEIYNYRELRAELHNLGYQFNSNSDTEVLLHAYKAWGIACLEKLDGMFAFALYDRNADRVYLVRDRMGIKPLYFSTQGNAISFASEIKALWHLPWMERRIAMRSVYHYLTYLATPAPATMFEGVYKLPAGFYASISGYGQILFTQWYDVGLKSESHFNERDLSKKSACVATVRSLLRAAVNKRLVADVPVGALLSGGLDSSFIVALMAEQHTHLKTFNVSFEHDDEHEERSWARKVAKRFGTDHHELIISEQEAFSFFQKMVYHQDEPLGDSVCVPLYFVSKLARDAGVKVVLLGEGSDELFCGYPMYVDYLALQPYWRMTQKYIPSFAKRGLYYAARPFYSEYPNRQDLIKTWADGRDLFWGGVRLFSEVWKHDVLQAVDFSSHDAVVQKMYPGFPQDSDSYAIADYYRKKFYERYPAGDFMAMMTYIELKHRLPELLLTRTDKMTMAASIEGRVPFLDRFLVEFMMRVPMKFKYGQNQTKYILKKAAEGIVPQDIIYRKKVGFAAPVTRWFKEGSYFREYLADTIQSNTYWKNIFNEHAISQIIATNRSSSVDYSYQLWALQNILAFSEQP